MVQLAIIKISSDELDQILCKILVQVIIDLYDIPDH